MTGKPILGNSGGKQTITLTIVILVGMFCAVLLVQWIDARRPPASLSSEEERPYLTDKTARRMSLAFNGLVADWYWMRSLQYVGRKIINSPHRVELDNLSQLNLKLLAPLLDGATTLDPEFLDPYEYAALVLPAVDVHEAIRITRKGIDANPTAWRLYQHLGYIYWQQHDFKTASETYAQGARLPGAPSWMQAMAAQMAAKGGSHSIAAEIYQRMYQESDDPGVKDMAVRRLSQIRFFVERDVIRSILRDFSARTKRCPASWEEISTALGIAHLRLDAAGVPLDPTNVPYVLVKEGCDVDLDPRSGIPRL